MPNGRVRAVHGHALRALVLVLVLVAALAAVGVAASDGLAITRYSFDGGGAHTEGGAYSLSGSIGEAVVGAVSAGSISMGSGFWAPAISHGVYLPFVK